VKQLGILQGRLGGLSGTPLELEFERAKELGLQCIELRIPEGDLHQHQIWSDEGIEQLRKVSVRTGIGTPSINGDHFKLGALTSPNGGIRSEGVKSLQRLILQSAKLKVERILLPFFDAGELQPERDLDLLADSLHQCLPEARNSGIQLSLETSLPAHENLRILSILNDSALRIYYDIGNAAALGFDLESELTALRRFISGVHIKDRILNGPNVPMGTGSVDFPKAFRLLGNLDYQGPWILETTPGDDPVAFAARHILYVRRQLET
jgi:L-ribulose-5-phosphate 3-epimerase